MFKIGTGFNPGFINDESSSTYLPFPKEVSLMELGPQEYLTLKPGLSKLLERYHPKLSLHIARSPISESADAQEAYIKKLTTLFTQFDFFNVGFHLTGPRNANIGKYGFSSYFDPTQPLLEENVIRFLENVSSQLKCEVWLENTNFYSLQRQNPLDLWGSIRRICEKTNVKLIVDIAHYLIDCANVGAPAESILGAIPWTYVRELHLSGITQSPDGAFHDGHSRPICERQWKLLEIILSYFIKDLPSLYITMEHTDFCWTTQKEAFLADFEKLALLQRRELSPSPSSRFADHQDRYAQSRLKKILHLHLPKVRTFCADKQLSFDVLFDEWISQLSLSDGHRLVFSAYEEEDGVAELSKNSFMKFFAERYPHVDRC